MKKILYLLIMSVMVLSVGMVSATVDFITPEEGDYVNDDVLVSWENGSYATSNLMYAEDECDGSLPGTIIVAGITYEGDNTWDISSLDDGDYCVKIAEGVTLHKEVSIVIDTTAPNITFDNTPYFVVKDSSIFINATLVDGDSIKNYTINFGDTSADGGADVGSAVGLINESHTYNVSGTYTVTITATDYAGNIATDTKTVLVNAVAPEWTIELSADEMNMFSIPLIPEDTDIEEVLDEAVSDNADKIWSYQEGEWIYNTPTSSGWSTSSSRKLQNIVPGYGYIIFMEDDAVVYGSGKELGQDVPPEVTLTTGWNLIGHYGLNDSIEVNEAFGSLELGNSYWNSLLAVDEDGDFENFVGALQPTEAYWLSIKSINLEEDELRYFTYFPAPEAY
jgi:hypothetical protein